MASVVLMTVEFYFLSIGLSSALVGKISSYVNENNNIMESKLGYIH